MRIWELTNRSSIENPKKLKNKIKNKMYKTLKKIGLMNETMLRCKEICVAGLPCCAFLTFWRFITLDLEAKYKFIGRRRSSRVTQKWQFNIIKKGEMGVEMSA